MAAADAHGPALHVRMFSDDETPDVAQAAGAADAVRRAVLPRLAAAGIALL
jgi:hypothetical protein